MDLMEMFCNLGNQIGPLWHWLQPHTTKHIGIWATSHQRQSVTAHEKVGPVTILNVNTPFQRLRPIYIPYGKTISAWAMDCYLILLSTLITTYTYNLVVATSLPSLASCVPIFFFVINHTKWTYWIECQLIIVLVEMFCNLGTRLVLPDIGCSLTQPKILVFHPSYTKAAQPMKKLAQSSQWQYSMSILLSKCSNPFVYLMGRQYLPGPWIAILFFTQHTHNHLQPCLCHNFT